MLRPKVLHTVFSSAQESRKSCCSVPFKTLNQPENVMTFISIPEVKALANLLFKNLLKPCHCVVSTIGRDTFFLHGRSWVMVCRTRTCTSQSLDGERAVSY
ncbi:hypothetical protein H1C71_006285 [Ictidomys tridecemlineatus]|nr:hypothetical protein H1C71_006285 [Ictidomys tridecemlineatus]